MSISGFHQGKARRELLSRAGQELAELRGQLSDAYRVFNATADPELLEASILEISALQFRCDRLLRDIKDMNGEFQNAARASHSARRRGRSDLPAAEAAEKTDQMGV